MSIYIRTSRDYIAAASPDTSSEELLQLSKSRVAAVRRRVAENARAPAALLKSLASDCDSHVRIAVGLNRSTELSVLSELIFDENPDVRFWLASASYLPERLLFELTEDTNPYVADRARRTLIRRNTDAPELANVFEFLEQDHSLVVAKLERLLKHHSSGSHDHLFDEVIDALFGIRRHFAQQHECCLDLISSSESIRENLFRKCSDDQKQIINAVDALLVTNLNDDGNFRVKLEELIARVIEHIRFAESELFETIQKNITPNALAQMNKSAQSALHAPLDHAIKHL